MLPELRTLVPSLLGIALVPASILADGPKFSGYVTGSYSDDLKDPSDGMNSTINGYGGRSNSFQLNAAHLTVAGGDSAGASYAIDLDGGTDGTHNGGTIHSDSAGGWAFDIQQAFATVPFGKCPLSLTAGKFYTSEGIEVANSGADPTITRGALYSKLEPFATTGAYLTFKAGDAISMSLGGVNGWDNWTTSPVDGIPMAYAKVALSFGNPFAGTVSTYFGPQVGTRDNLFSLDLTGLNKSVEDLAINIQANYLRKDRYSRNLDGVWKDWNGFGFGLQPVYVLGSAQLGARYEVLSMDDGAGPAVVIQSISAAPGYRPTQNSLIRVEYRFDYSSTPYFPNSNAPNHSNYDQVVTAELNYTF